MPAGSCSEIARDVEDDAVSEKAAPISSDVQAVGQLLDRGGNRFLILSRAHADVGSDAGFETRP